MMMDVQLSESDDEFEIISIDPNINYESDDASMDEDDEFTPAPAVAVAIEESESATNQNTLNGSQQEAATMCEIMEVCTATSIKQEDELSCDSSTMTNLDNSLENSNDSTPLDCQQQKKVKRKLNLQEYKMRRANDPIEKFEDVPRSGKIIELCQDVPETLPPLPLPTDPCYLSQNQNKPKVWKEEEISKQHVQVVDKETPAMLHPDYEEIIIVSVACNTEVTVSPSEQDDEETGGDKFLKNIVNNLNKDSVETLMSSSSLFSSIQQVIQDKCSAANEDSKSISQENKSGNEHGEDKVIMHLRKDRQRPQQSCIAIQTDSISLFPPLILNPTLIFNRIRNVRSYRRKMSRSRSRSRSRSFSPSAVEFENRFNNKFDRRYARSQHSTHSSSLNSSESSSDSDSDSSSHYSSSRSSASSKQSDSKYSQSYAFFNQRNNQRNQKFGFPGKLIGSFFNGSVPNLIVCCGCCFR